MKTRIQSFAVATLFLIIPPAFADIGIGIKASTLGGGLELNYGFNALFSATVGYNRFTLNRPFSDENEELEYNVSLKLRSLPILANFHPFSGGFRLTGGLLINSNEISGTATPKADTIEIGDVTYTAEEVGSLKATITFSTLTPYLGIGWGHEFKETWGLIFDLGASLQGSPDLSLEASGLIATNQDFLDDLEEEEKNAKENFTGFALYPVVSLGIYMRFNL